MSETVQDPATLMGFLKAASSTPRNRRKRAEPSDLSRILSPSTTTNSKPPKKQSRTKAPKPPKPDLFKFFSEVVKDQYPHLTYVSRRFPDKSRKNEVNYLRVQIAQQKPFTAFCLNKALDAAILAVKTREEEPRDSRQGEAQGVQSGLGDDGAVGETSPSDQQCAE